MSSPSGYGWTNVVLLLLVGGVVAYSLARGPGSCPFTAAPQTSLDSPADAGGGAATGTTTSLVHANDSSFDAIVKKAEGPVLVDFYADWCGPCKQLAPVLDRVAQNLTGGQIVKVNVDHSPELASRYGVQSIPTLLVFDDGQVVKRSVGLHSEEEVRRLLQ
ncbi:MAG: thioredoxin [Thermoguttaceae bacterium]